MKAPEKMRLAVAAMGNDEAARATLARELGITDRIVGLAELHAIMSDAFDAMTPAEQAADYRQTVRALDALAAAHAAGRGVS